MGKKTPDDIINMTCEAVECAKSKGAKIIGVNAEDASRSSLEFLIKLAREVKSLGASRFRYCDTLGYDDPQTAYERVKLIAQETQMDIEMHFHNDLGMAVACSVMGAKAAIDAGVDAYINTAINGMGERAGNADLVSCILAITVAFVLFPLVNVNNTAKAASVSNWVTCTNCSNYRVTVNLIINGVSEGSNNYVDGTYEANISQYQVSSPVYLKSSLRPNSATIYVDRSIYSSLDQLNINVQLGSFTIHSKTGEVRWGIQIFGGHSGSPRTYLGSGAEYASSNGYNYYIYQSNPSHSGILSA